MLRTRDILDRLKTARTRKALRQDYVARCLGIDRTTYVRKEMGVIPITTDEWLKLADALEEEPAYFFTISTARLNESAMDVREMLLVRLYRSLKTDEREELVCCLHLMLKGIRRKGVRETLDRLRQA